MPLTRPTSKWDEAHEEVCYAHPYLRNCSREWYFESPDEEAKHLLYWLFPRHHVIAQPVVIVDVETLLIHWEGFL